MEDLLKLTGAAVAIVASLAAVGVTVEQLTLRSRLRKTEAWAAAQIQQAGSPERTKALRQIQLESTARLVAGLHVPVRFFAEGALATIAVPATVAAMMQDEQLSMRALLALVGIASTSLLLSTRRAVRVYLERCRIASEYVRSKEVAAARLGMLNLMEGGTKVEFAYAAGFSLSVSAFAVGLGLAMSGRPVDGLPLLLLVLGGLTSMQVLDLLRTHARARYPLDVTDDAAVA